ncbi:MAG: hypothetical protein Q8L35_02555 [Actinomycetota bacterium]|nr:hypothetical protein [Actinomycetota bacterium]
MASLIEDSESLILTLRQLFERAGNHAAQIVLEKADTKIEQTDHDNDLFTPLIGRLKQGEQFQQGGQRILTEPTGWARVDRNIGEVRTRLAQAEHEEQFQAVGLLCRETMISLAQMVYRPEEHLDVNGVRPSNTDAKRMLDACLAQQLPGEDNEAVRRHAKAALALANDLTHKRTAGFREAAMCAEATTSLVNIIAIISGQRDPK